MVSRQALEGVRVVELATTWAGPFGAKLLGDAGAEVIKVEALRRIDSFRGDVDPPGPGPYPNNEPGAHPLDRAPQFNDVNRNKLSVLADLTTPEGKKTFEGLVKVSDVVVENFAPRVFQNFGYSYQVLCSLRPDIVLVSMPAYGLEGPYRDYRGYGGNLAELSGLVALTGYPDCPPTRLPTPLPDPISSFHAADAILAALYHRRRTGEGQHIEVPMVESAVAFVGEHILDFAFNRKPRRGLGNYHPSMAPHGVYPVQGRDRWIAISVCSEVEWNSLCEIAGRQEWVGDPGFAASEKRVANRDRLDKLLGQWTATQDGYKLMRILQSSGIGAGAVLDSGELLHDSHMTERRYFELVPHPDAGSHLYPGPSWKLSGTPAGTRLPAPRLGEHSEFVTGELLGLRAAK